MGSFEFEHLQEYGPYFENYAEAKLPEGKRAQLKAATEVMHENAKREELKALMATATVKKILKDLVKFEEFKFKIKNNGKIPTLSK